MKLKKGITKSQAQAVEKAINQLEKLEKKITKMISKPNSQYKTVYEWKEAAPEYFKASVQNGWLNKVCDEIGWEYYEEEKDIGLLNKN